MSNTNKLPGERRTMLSPEGFSNIATRDQRILASYSNIFYMMHHHNPQIAAEIEALENLEAVGVTPEQPMQAVPASVEQPAPMVYEGPNILDEEDGRNEFLLTSLEATIERDTPMVPAPGDN